MCKEAESLVPIVSCRPQQVVLFGDHKQLQPISLNKTAQSFGLNRSLFDRYASRAHMLTIHYRMVHSLSVCLSVCMHQCHRHTFLAILLRHLSNLVVSIFTVFTSYITSHCSVYILTAGHAAVRLVLDLVK